MKQPAAPRKKLGRSQTGTALRVKQFAEEYLRNGHNASAAGRAVGFGGVRLDDTAHKFLNRPDVQALIQARARKVSEAAEMTTANWAKELSAVAFSNIGDLYDEAGGLRPVHTLPRHVQASLSSIKVSPDGDTIEYKFWDKNAALQTIARHLGLFERDNAQRQPDVRVNVVLVG